MTTTSFMLATILNITPKERFLSSKVKSNSFKREDGGGFTIDAAIYGMLVDLSIIIAHQTIVLKTSCMTMVIKEYIT